MGSSGARSRAATFPKSARVRTRSEFLALGRSGRRMPTRHFLLLHAPSASGPTRLGITVTRKVGGAVVRNRIKRAVREPFRRCRQTLPDRLAIVVIARVGAADLAGREIAAELDPALREVGRLAATERGAPSDAGSEPPS